MKKLLSLPPNVVSSFHALEEADVAEWYCTSDPVGERLGSGGGTAWLLDSCRREEQPDQPMGGWLAQEKRILLHAAGQSRRLPAYAALGKVLTPIPVFRWARGQQLSQNLLSLQLPLYEKIMAKAPDNLHTLVASGDVYIRTSQPLAEIPRADVVCYGLWADPSLAVNHGVFLSRRDAPDQLDFMLQKPSLEELSDCMTSHFFLLDIGIWLLSDKAVEVLMKKCGGMSGEPIGEYDLYGQFGLSLGTHPRIEDLDFAGLTVAVMPLNGGEFYHFGTSKELISSTLAIQNLVNDQRLIMHRKVKPHPAMFVQNASVYCALTAENSTLWIENSYIAASWRLHDKHLITGVPENQWALTVPSGVCIDVVPVDEAAWVARPYGFADLFKGGIFDDTTLYLGQPVRTWAEVRGVRLPDCPDIQYAALFPICDTIEELGEVMRWMIAEPHHRRGKEIWEQKSKLSAYAIMDRANLIRLTQQRKEFQRSDWPILAKNHERSVFYQLDLADAARSFARQDIPLPPPLPAGTPLIKGMNDAMFRARVQQLRALDHTAEQERAFRLLQEGIVEALKEKRQSPRLSVYPDQIVWGRSPVRIDLAGGWTDTPPFCLYEGGAVVNLAIELNGQPPLQVYIKPTTAHRIVLRSIDMGRMEEVNNWEELLDYRQVGSPFSIPKAALALAGFAPDFAVERYISLQEQLKHLGCGIEITLLAAIPAGSGLGTSSILAATVLGALSDFCGLGWDKNEIGNRSLILEQLLTTGGGWQDPYGGLLHGLKLLQTHEGFEQCPLTRWLPEYLFTDAAHQPCHLLYYTGITRTAKDILAEIVQGMFLNSGAHLSLLREMKEHALEMYKTIQGGDFTQYGRLVGKSWEQNKRLDKGTNPPEVEWIIRRVKEYCLGYKLPGAGGGGYLYMVAKDPEAAMQIRHILTRDPLHANARFVEMNLSPRGLQVSRS